MARTKLSRPVRKPPTGKDKVKWPSRLNAARPEAVSTPSPKDGVWKNAEKLRPGDVLVFRTGMRRHHWQVQAVTRSAFDASKVKVQGCAPDCGATPTWTYKVGSRVQVLPPGELPTCL